MVHAILLCCAMFADGGKPAEPTATDRAAYQAALAKVGKTAAAHIQLALWCEAHGLTTERIKHLTEAVSLDPSNELARGLLGLVPFQGKWANPDEVKNEIQNDPKSQALFREYLDRRAHTPQNKPDAQLRLAAWCLEKGLKDEAMAHYHLVTRLDPSRDVAWIRLGYKKQKDRWFKPESLAARKIEAEQQKRAEMRLKPRLEKLREGIESKIEGRRLKSERELYLIIDPRAVSLIASILGNGSEQTQIVAVELLSQIEGPAASFYSENKPVVTQVIAPHTACFAAGTLVQTVAGPRKIESVALGDRVLSQQTSTGGLSFQPVLATHLNGPSQTLRIAIDGETIVATGIHRFWKAGTGWTMARDLKPGDRLRMISGVASIQSIEPGTTQMVYNLDVAENRDFLVGNSGLLVHDFSFVQPVIEPFDRQTNPSLAAKR